MKVLKLVPDGWPCSLEECRPGHFVHDGIHLGFKTEYRKENGSVMAFNEAGEYFCVTDVHKVQAVSAQWEDE